MSDRRKVLDLFEAQKDYMDDRVEHGIEMYRKGFGYITVTDAEGKAIADAKVSVKLKNHEFRFGANIFMLDELETPEKNEAYKKHFAELFNMATLPFYWDSTEPEEGKTHFKGFYGDYDVEITAGGKTVTKTLNLGSKNRTNEYTFKI